MKVTAYLQGANGEEFVLRVDQPEPACAKLDKTIFFTPEAIAALAHQPEPNYYWVRVVSHG